MMENYTCYRHYLWGRLKQKNQSSVKINRKNIWLEIKWFMMSIKGDKRFIINYVMCVRILHSCELVKQVEERTDQFCRQHWVSDKRVNWVEQSWRIQRNWIEYIGQRYFELSIYLKIWKRKLYLNQIITVAF